MPLHQLTAPIGSRCSSVICGLLHFVQRIFKTMISWSSFHYVSDRVRLVHLTVGRKTCVLNGVYRHTARHSGVNTQKEV